jgi:hypothetical protein
MGEHALMEGNVAVEKLKEGMKAKKERLKHSLKTMSDAEKINITEMPKEVAVGTGERVGGVDEEIAVWVANRTASTNTLGGFFSVCNPSSGELLLDFIDDVLLFSGYTSNHLVKRLEHATGGPSAFCSSSSSLTKNNPTLVQLPSTFLPPSSLHTSLTNCVRSLSSLHPVSPAAISSDSVVASLPLINHPSESPLYQLLRTLCQCLSLSLSFSALFSESDQVISSEPGKTLYVSPLYSSVQSVSSSLLYDTHPSSFDSIGFISVDGFLSSLSTPFTSSLVSSSSPSSYVTSLFSVLMPFINKESRLESSDSVQQPRALLDLLPSSLSMQVLINTLNEAMNHYHSCLSASLLSLSITQHSIQSLNRERNPDYAHNRKKENSLYIPTSFPLPNSFPSTNMFATSEDSPFLNAPPAPLINETTSSLPFMSSSEPIPMQQYDRSPTASQTVRVPTGSTILRVEVMAVLHQHLSDVYAFAKTLLSLLRRNDTTYGYIVRTTRTEVLAKWEQQKASGADVGAIPVIENIDDEIIGYLFPVFDRIIDLLREFVKSNGFIGEDNT